MKKSGINSGMILFAGPESYEESNGGVATLWLHRADTLHWALDAQEPHLVREEHGAALLGVAVWALARPKIDSK